MTKATAVLKTVLEKAVVRPPSKPVKTVVAQRKVPGLYNYAVICAVERALKILKEEYAAPVEERVIDDFLTDGLALRSRPANFRGVEGDASASVELKQRSDTSPLTDLEVALLAKHNIPVEVVGVPETFRINPAYVGDTALIKSVAKKLKALDLPEDFFEVQAATTKTVVCDDTIKEVFRRRSEVAKRLLGIVTVVCFKTKVESATGALKRVKTLFDGLKT